MVLVDVIAPRNLILPTIKTRSTATASNRGGEIFVSGGSVFFMSGTTMIRLSGALLEA